MLFTKFAALAFTAVVAAGPIEPEEHQHETRAPYLGVLYSQPNFRGARQTISDRDSGRCINLAGSLREDVQSINIDRRERDSCTLYDRRGCQGSSQRYTSDNRNIARRRVSSVRCHRGR